MQGKTQSISFDGREIRLTTGRFAPQAGGSVLVECGDTAVLVTATRSKGRDGIDFLPLLCDYGVDPIPVVVGYGSTHKVRAHVEHDVNDAHDEACDGRAHAQRSSSVAQ